MRILVYGIVQGVGFRPAVYRIAKSLGCRGYVRNNGSNVEISVDRNHEKFLRRLKAELPPLARIDRVEMLDDEKTAVKSRDFVIVTSAIGNGLCRDPSIPPDTALCPDCIKDIAGRGNRRFRYPFTNCTNCGARFAVVSAQPYDRANTSMAPFKLCSACRDEYWDPENRRFHAQTISCPADGPAYSLYDNTKQKVITKDPVREFAHLIDGGKIGVVKGWGGMHIVCILSKAKRLRSWYRRPQKPFAVMVRDPDSAENYAHLTGDAKKLLQSPQRPIVLVEKRHGARVGRSFDRHIDRLLEDISPGLDSIGIYLPYSGLHHVLFTELKGDALVMTSANPSGEPMITENGDAFSLGLDCYLLHNREIVNRIDDSVVIPCGRRTFFIRRSRGYVPAAIEIRHRKNVVSLGAQENVTSSLSSRGSLCISQYIGDTTNYNVLRFLDSATGYLMKLAGIGKIDAVGIDLHPQYPTRHLGEEWAEKYDAPLVEVQHHWAHAASLMLDNRMNEPIVALTLDGAGYGTDGTVWGGEIIAADYKTFERVGSLEKIPLIGGDAAVSDPKRLVFAISEKIGGRTGYFDKGKERVLRRMMGKSIGTSSMGRLLDALSCRLGICTAMTYDGEPAMKMEKYLKAPGRGVKNDFSAETVRVGHSSVVRTLPLFETLEDVLKGCKTVSERMKNRLAYYFVNEVVKSLVEIAAEEADERGIKHIGITGGVSYNIPITAMAEEYARARGFRFITHCRIPNGDGGISAGQNAIVGNLI